VYWAVVQSQPMCERRALWHLNFQGFTAYAPREKIIRVSRGKKIAAWRWLFPRYIFVWITTQWHALFSTIGVARVLMTGDKPSKLPERWIKEMRAQEHNGLITLPKHRFKIGTKVQVTSGLLAGQKGLYQGMTSRQREIVLLETLGRVELASGLLSVKA
jgi:transcription antitermination factor NusG